MGIGWPAKIFGFYPEDKQDLVKQFQGELRKFLRSMLLKEATLAACYPRYGD